MNGEEQEGGAEEHRKGLRRVSGSGCWRCAAMRGIWYLSVFLNRTGEFQKSGNLENERKVERWMFS